ncbi:MAG TPA: glycosyltransferase family 87 protein [Candidatus Limnocylindrales bacterium]
MSVAIQALVARLPSRVQRRLDRITEPTAAFVRRRLGLDLFLAIGIALVVLRLYNVPPWDDKILDLHAYWMTRFGFNYAASNPFAIGAYLYSPVFAQVIAPLTAMSFPVFAGLWTLMIVITYVWLTGRWAMPFLFSIAIALELYLGQIDILIAAAIVVGFRYPAVWAFPLLTKVAPGIGLAWFVFRGEWRKLAIALATTVAIAAVSAFFTPYDWKSWFDFLASSFTQPHPVVGDYITIPYLLRVPVALAVIWWGARTDRYWTVPVGVLIAMPILWVNVFSLLIAVIPLRHEPGLTPAREWLSRGIPLFQRRTSPRALRRAPGG